MTKAWRRAIPALILVLGLVTTGCGSGSADGGQDGATGDAKDGAPAKEATREQLATVVPDNAPGQQLYLEEVTIPPGVKLAKHIHDGVQIANVRRGTLTYVIESGSTTVTRANGDEEQVTGPATIELRRGDWLVENRSLVHYGENLGDEPVVVTIAVLLSQGAPLATPVD